MNEQQANNIFTIGTKVKYFPIQGENEFKETVIRSEVWALGHGELVVKVEGIRGGICVDHLELAG